MNKLKYLIILSTACHFISCQTQKTDREIEDEFVAKYAPKNLETHGFTLPVASEVSEVHQLFNDLEKNFYFYGDKVAFEKKAAKIRELDPDYPSGVLMSGFYITDPDVYKAMVTKAYHLSKKSQLKSERDIIKAEYLLLVKEDYPEAQKHFQKVVDMYPDSPAAIWSLGMAYYYNDELDKALECYEKSTELIPDLPKGYEFMSVIYATKGDNQKALEYLEKVKKHGANAQSDIYFSEYENILYYKAGLYKKSMKTIEEAYTYGERFKNSESLNKTYEVSKRKFESIQALKLE